MRGQYGGGDGSEESPYLIYTAGQLNEIGATTTDLGAHFQLMADINLIDFKKKEFHIIGADLDHPFEGVFDGNGFRILNFSYQASVHDYTGLFGVVGEYDGNDSGIIRNLGMVDVAIHSGTSLAAGGLVGFLAQGQIENCYVKNGTISNNYNFVGGVAGVSWGEITASYSDVQVSGLFEVGGFIGALNQSGTITNCYSRGSVNGTQYVGGFVGDLGAGTVIENCYSTGVVSGGADYGGLVGINSGEIINCFWDYQTSGITFMCGSEDDGTGCNAEGGKTSEEMTQEDTFDTYGWDFDDEPIWKIKESQELPRLYWEVVNPVTFVFEITGGQVVGEVVTEASGQGIIRYDQADTQISWAISYDGLNQDPNSAITTVVIRGPADTGQTGDIQVDLLANSVAVDDLTQTAPFKLTEEQAEQLLAGHWYVEISTAGNPEGEIRGQIVKSNEIALNKVTLKASRSRQTPKDSIQIIGKLYLTSDEASVSDLIAGNTFEWAIINLDDEQNEINNIVHESFGLDINETQLSRSGVYTYRRPKAEELALRLLQIDFNKNNVKIDAKPADLSGLREPFKITVGFGPYRGEVVLDATHADKLNRGQSVPICLLAGIDDAIRLKNAVVRSSRKGDSLIAKGGFAAAEPDLNLTDETLEVQWGEFSQTLPVGALVAKRGHNYTYTKPKDGIGEITKFNINMDKYTFQLNIKNAAALDAEGTVEFKMQSEHFNAEDEWDFDQ